MPLHHTPGNLMSVRFLRKFPLTRPSDGTNCYTTCSAGTKLPARKPLHFLTKETRKRRSSTRGGCVLATLFATIYSMHSFCLRTLVLYPCVRATSGSSSHLLRSERWCYAPLGLGHLPTNWQPTKALFDRLPHPWVFCNFCFSLFAIIRRVSA